MFSRLANKLRQGFRTCGSAAKPIDFDSVSVFVNKPTRELLRASFVIYISSYELFVRKSLQCFHLGQRLLGKHLFNSIMKPTFYNQFVAGDNLADLSRVRSALSTAGINLMLYVTIEDTQLTEPSLIEKELDNNLQSVLSYVSAAKHSANNIQPICQLKITSLVQKQALKQLASVCDIRGRHAVAQGVAKLLSDPSQTKVLIAECSASGADVINDQSVSQLIAGVQRLRAVASAAGERGVRLLLDAEYTYLNPALDAIALALMICCNTDAGSVWYTYQAYLKNTAARLDTDRRWILDQGLHFGCKVVRGAYMIAERERAAMLGIESPVCDSYEATSHNYDQVAATMIAQVADTAGRCGLMVASHNERSVLRAVHRLHQAAVDPRAGHILFAQIFGMGDQISYALGRAGYLVYKSVPYGAIDSTLPYLSRRAQENNVFSRSARRERDLLLAELRRRVWRS